jgi:hypothetical protein
MMKFTFLFLACALAGLSGCASPGGSLPKERTGLPLPREGAAALRFDVPAGWRVTEVGPDAGVDADYILSPDGPKTDVYLALLSQPLTNGAAFHEGNAHAARLREIHQLNDPKVTLSRVGMAGGTGLYLYQSDYWCYRLAAIHGTPGFQHTFELYAPDEASLAKYRPALETVVTGAR